MRIHNKHVSREFTVEQKYEAGIVLQGQEVKAVKLGHADLTGSYVKILGSEAFLINARIFPYEFARTDGYLETRTRKLLLHKSELLKMKTKLGEGKHTLVGLALYETKSGLVKVEVGLARGKKSHEREKDVKQRIIQRDLDREFKEENY